MNAQEKLTEAKRKFDLLKLNQDAFSIGERLLDANVIKKKIAQDSILEEECRHNHDINKTRGELIDSISDFQRSIVESVSISRLSSVKKDEVDFDYAETKTKLGELIQHTISNVEKYDKDRQSLENLEGLNASLGEIYQNLLDDRYKILLMAKYQSGKTTTLKTFCGGMDIGVTGRGDATTAVPSEIRYSKEESIDVAWKTKEDVREIFSLEDYMPELKYIDIDDEASREKMLQEIETIRKQEDYAENNSLKASRYFALCSFVLKYWGTPELNRIQEKALTKQEVLKYSTFPIFGPKERWYNVWENSGMESFPIEKCVFVFMKQISISSPFKTLERMNSLIVDCPGLFASAYDTKVTENLMKKAEAILFIISQGQTVGGDESEIYKALAKLKTEYSDYESKLFIADNKSFLNDDSLETMIPSDKETIIRLFGKNVPFFGYDAKLAYLEQIKKSYDNNDLDETSIQSFIRQNPKIEYVKDPITDKFVKDPKTGKRKTKTIPVKTFDEAWENAIKEYEFKNLSIGDSMFEELQQSIQTFIEQNKAYALIISEGINKIENELVGIQRNLASGHKEPYLKGRQELENDWNRRIERAEEFEAFANNEIHSRLFNVREEVAAKSLCDRLSDSVYKKLFSDEIYDSLCDNIISEILANLKIIAYLKMKEKMKESKIGQFALDLFGTFGDVIDEIICDGTTLEDFMSSLMSKQIESTISKRVDYWNTLLSSNQDNDFNGLFAADIENFKHDIEKRWMLTYKDDELLREQMDSYYYISSSTSKFFEYAQYGKQHTTDVQGLAIFGKFVLDLSGLMAAVGGIIVGIVAALIASAPLAALISAAGAAGSGFWLKRKLMEKAEREFKEDTKPGLKKQLDASGLYTEIKKMVSGQVRQLLTRFKDNTVFDKEKLNAQRDQAMANLESADKEERCFKAVDMMQFLGEQISEYEELKKSLMRQNNND